MARRSISLRTPAGAGPLPGRARVHVTLRGSFAARLAALLAGLFLFALGIALTLRSGLGLGPWDVLHQGLTRHAPISFGAANIAVGVVVLAAAVALGVRPGLGTLLNALLIGAFLELLLDTGVVPAPAGLAARIGLDLGGVALVGVASALYIGAGLGAGPRDSLMVALAQRLRFRIGAARTMLELSVLCAGALLGGSVGAGTAIFALGVGPAVDAAFLLLARTPAARPAPARAAVCDGGT